MSQNEEKTPHIYAKKGLNVACDQVDIMPVHVGIQVNNPSVMDHMKVPHLPPNGLKLASLEPITFAYVNTARECLFVMAPIPNLSIDDGTVKQYHSWNH